MPSTSRINQSTNQSVTAINQSINHAVKKSISQSIRQSGKQWNLKKHCLGLHIGVIAKPITSIGKVPIFENFQIRLLLHMTTAAPCLISTSFMEKVVQKKMKTDKQQNDDDNAGGGRGGADFSRS